MRIIRKMSFIERLDGVQVSNAGVDWKLPLIKGRIHASLSPIFIHVRDSELKARTIEPAILIPQQGLEQ